MKKRFLKKRTIGSAFLVLVFLLSSLISCTGQQKHHVSTAKHRFDDIQKWVSIFEDPERDAWQKPDKVVENLHLKQGFIIADIGAGTGYFTRRFARAVGPTGTAFGLDIEPSMVKYMKEDARRHHLKNYIAQLVQPDDPGLNPQSVDIVFICNTYHHVGDRVDYLKKMSMALKKKGRVVIVDFYKKPLPVGPHSLEDKLSENEVIREFQEAGYRLIRSMDFLPYQYFLEFAF